MPLMITFLSAMLLLASSLPVCAEAPQSDTLFKDRLTSVLQENPGLLLEPMREVDEQIFELMQQAALKKRQRPEAGQQPESAPQLRPAPDQDSQDQPTSAAMPESARESEPEPGPEPSFAEQLAWTLRDNPEVILEPMRSLDTEPLEIMQQAAARQRQGGGEQPANASTDAPREEREQASEPSQNASFEERLAWALKEDNTLLLEAIQAVDMEVLELMQQAARKKRQEEVRQQRERELQSPLQPVVEPERVLKGPAQAPVTIVEYSDFQCPYCSRLARDLDQVMTQLGDEARLVFKHNPLAMHPSAMQAAMIFEAVFMQDKEAGARLYKLLFENGDRLDELGEKGMLALAVQAGAKREAVRKAMRSPEVHQRIQADIAEFRSFGFQGVPVLLVNGVSVRGAVPAEDILELVRMTRKNRSSGDTQENAGD